MGEPVCIVPAGDWTGEGATWSADEKALYWVDISRSLVHRYDTQSRSVRTWFFDQPPTTLALTDRLDTLVVAVGGRVILWQPVNDARAEFAYPEKNWPRARLNDGRADPAGNFWVGSMQNNVADNGSSTPITDNLAGRLFRIAADGSVTVEKTGIGISNTFCWSPDARQFYSGDTLENVIHVWDFDSKAGRATNERPFFSGFERGSPDGSAVDRDGYLWNARYGGGCVVRVAPDGRVDMVLEMPVDNVTTCTFGDNDLRTLYITTASGGNNKEPRFAGGLFTYRVDVPGLPENRFRLGH
jgi:sugar lactone lactonase YvrE